MPRTISYREHERHRHSQLQTKIQILIDKILELQNEKNDETELSILRIEEYELRKLLKKCNSMNVNALKCSLKHIESKRKKKIKHYKLERNVIRKQKQKQEKEEKQKLREEKKKLKKEKKRARMPVIDPSIMYSTNAIITKVGRAIAVSLNDANLIGTAKNKHMTILFRRGNKWTQDDIDKMTKAKNNWIKQQQYNDDDNHKISFTIKKWGGRSVEIKGDLENLCLHLRQTFDKMSDERQRPPHVELFR